MPIYISEENALSKMTEIEGQKWQAQQEEDHTANCSFYLFHSVWEKELKGNYDLIAKGVKLGCFISSPNNDGAIYGSSGFNRYAVRVDGRIFFLRDLAINEAALKKAIELGFDII
jgi:hypothetical protein